MNKWLLLPILILVGCSTTKPLPETAVPIQESAVSGTAIDLQNTESLRYGESLKAYPVGRYQDPDNPYILHEAHTIYRAEQPARWNLNPNAPTVVPLGPTVAVADPARQTATLSGELEEKIAKQNQLLQATYEQNEELSKEIKTLQGEAEKAQAVLNDNEQLRKQVAEQQAVLDFLKAQATKPASAADSSHPAWWQAFTH